MTRLKEQAEEILETLWMRGEEGKTGAAAITDLCPGVEQGSLEQLLGAGLVTNEGNLVRLTERGREEARNVVRRHRLAERLLADVLDANNALLEEHACKFEHLLDRGLDESICSLLGHPKICPHGKPIPPGKCCRAGHNGAQRLVFSLAQLERGQGGKVAYIYAAESNQLQKLMAMGILPGAPITLVQSFPSYVFQVGQSQFAVDREIADAIYVRKS